MALEQLTAQALAGLLVAISPNVPGPKLDAQGWAALTSVLEGEAVAVSHRVTIEKRESDWFEVHERIKLHPGHTSLELVVPDRESTSSKVERELLFEGEPPPRGVDTSEELLAYLHSRLREVPAEYSPTDWGIRGIQARVDGEPVELQFRVWSHGPAVGQQNFDGGWAFRVAASASVIDVQYRLRAHLLNTGVDLEMDYSLEGRSSWQEASAAPSVLWSGIKVATALHLNVETDGRWLQRGDEIVFHAREGRLSVVGLHLRIPRCKDIDRPGSSCDGHVDLYGPTRNWLKGAHAGCYDPQSLRRARNWIFARHGRPFDSKDLREFFEEQPWYRADPSYTASGLTAGERATLGVILGLEAQADCDDVRLDDDTAE